MLTPSRELEPTLHLFKNLARAANFLEKKKKLFHILKNPHDKKGKQKENIFS